MIKKKAKEAGPKGRKSNCRIGLKRQGGATVQGLMAIERQLGFILNAVGKG